MLTLKQKSSSKVSWAPIYYIVSLFLSVQQLNFFSDTFNDRLCRKVITYGILTFQTFTGLVCLTELVLPNNYDQEDTFACLIILLTIASVALKAITLINHSAALKQFRDVILKETSRDDLEPWELKLAQKYYRNIKCISVNIIVLYYVTTAAFIVYPALSQKDKMLPVLMEYPWTNRSDHPGYEINYFIGSYGIFYGVTIEIGFDVPAFMQACFISYQLDRCAHYCGMIGDFETSYNTEAKQSKLLKDCIKFHSDIFTFINKVSNINSYVVAITVITIVPLLTVVIFSILSGTASAAPLLALSLVYHLFMYCFLGEMVSTKCNETSNAIYTSQWYRIQKAEDRSTILFFLTVSQTDMRFSAKGLFKLSLETFTELMKFIYGACTFLKNVL